MDWHLRDLSDADLEDAVALEALSTTSGQPALFGLADVVASLVAGQPAVAVEAGGRLVGTAVGRMDHDRGWILRITLHPSWRQQGLGSELLAALEQRLVAAGARRLTCALPKGETGTLALRNSGFAERADIAWFDQFGQAMTPDAWNEPEARTLTLRRATGAEDGSVDATLLLLNADGAAHDFTLPAPAMDWTIVLDTADPEAEEYRAEGESVPVAAHSVVLLATRLPAT